MWGSWSWCVFLIFRSPDRADPLFRTGSIHFSNNLQNYPDFRPNVMENVLWSAFLRARIPTLGGCARSTFEVTRHTWPYDWRSEVCVSLRLWVWNMILFNTKHCVFWLDLEAIIYDLWSLDIWTMNVLFFDGVLLLDIGFTIICKADCFKTVVFVVL